MASFKLLRKIFPASPDKYLKYAPSSQASLARMAHLNGIINDINDYGFYEHDCNTGLTIDVTTSKGIIELVNFETFGPATGAFADSTGIIISHPAILNPPIGADEVYTQITPYYNPGGLGDTTVPYVIPTGGGPIGRLFNVYNAAATGANDWTGLFYIYYELKVIK